MNYTVLATGHQDAGLLTDGKGSDLLVMVFYVVLVVFGAQVPDFGVGV